MKIYVRGKRSLLGLLGVSLVLGPLYAVAWLLGPQAVHILNASLVTLAALFVLGVLWTLGIGLISIALGSGKD